MLDFIPISILGIFCEFLYGHDIISLLSLFNNRNLQNIISKLKLSVKKITDSEIEIISKWMNLKHLKITPARYLENAKYISLLTNLQHLDLKNIYNFDQSKLKSLSHLTYLASKTSFISKSNTLDLINLPDSLQCLSIKSDYITNISFLQTLKILNSLTLCDILNMEDSKFKNIISTLTNLISLDLTNNLICDIRFISSLTNLKYLNLSHNNIDRNSSQYIKYLTNLEILSLINCVMVENLPLLYRLRKLYLGCDTLDISIKLEMHDFEMISNLTSLETLVFYTNINTSLEEIILLTNLKSLRKLVLVGMDLIDDHLQIFEILTQLRYLDISTNNHITNNGLKYILNLSNLEEFIFKNTDHKIDLSDGILSLLVLENLKIINIENNAGITPDTKLLLNNILNL